MLQEREVVSLIVSAVAGILIYLRRNEIRSIPAFGWLVGAYCALVANLTFSVWEVFAWPDILNFLQHVCSVLTSILLAFWCWLVFIRRRKETA